MLCAEGRRALWRRGSSREVILFTVVAARHFPPSSGSSPQIAPVYLGDSATHLPGQKQRHQLRPPGCQMQPSLGIRPEPSRWTTAPGRLTLPRASQGRGDSRSACSISPSSGVEVATADKAVPASSASCSSPGLVGAVPGSHPGSPLCSRWSPPDTLTKLRFLSSQGQLIPGTPAPASPELV